MVLRHRRADSRRNPADETVGTAPVDVELPPACLVDDAGTDVATEARVEHLASRAVARRAPATVTDVALQTPRVGQQTQAQNHPHGKEADEMLNHKSHPRLEQVHARTAATSGGS